MINFFTKKKIQLSSPNILLTNCCNAKCSYCFARDEMDEDAVKEMEIDDFVKVVKMLKKHKIKLLRLMGGEPTLHSQFDKVIEIGVKNFEKILIFSNGLIPVKYHGLLKQGAEKLIFNFNLDTLEFNNNPILKAKIVNLVKSFIGKAEINIGFTIYSSKKNYLDILNDFSKQEIREIGIRFGYEKSVIGLKPIFVKSKYRQLGKFIVKTVRGFVEAGIKDIYVDCGMEKTMFNNKELKYFLSNVKINGWKCSGKWSGFEIASDLSVFPCFPYYKEQRKKLSNFSNFSEIQSVFQNKKPCYNN